MNKQYYPLHYDFNHPLEFYHNPFGARRPIPHEHDKNDKVRIDCYDCSAGYLQDKISACNGIAIVRELDENCNSRLILSSTINEFGMYSAGEGIDKNLLEYSSTISVSGFDNYFTKEEISSYYTPKKFFDKVDFDLSLLYNSAKTYYDDVYNVVKSNSGEWNNEYQPGESIKQHLDYVESNVNAIANNSSYWNDASNVVSIYSGDWNAMTSGNYVDKRDYQMLVDMFQHGLQQLNNKLDTAYKLIEELSGKINNDGV